MKVFISHSFDDSNKFDDLCLSFEQEEIKYWDPKEMPAGTSLRDKLRAAIKECPVCIFIVTQNSLNSGWCQAEVGAFWGASKPVILWLADGNVSNSDLPEQFLGDIYATAIRDVLKSVKLNLENAHSTPSVNDIRIEDYTILVGPPMKVENVDMSRVEWDNNNCYIRGHDFEKSISLEPSRVGTSFEIRLRNPILKELLERRIRFALDIKDKKGNNWKSAKISLNENFVYLNLSNKGHTANGGN